MHSIHIVLQLAHHDLIMGTSTLRPKLWNPVSSEKRMSLEIDPGLGDAHLTPPLCMNLPSS